MKFKTITAGIFLAALTLAAGAEDRSGDRRDGSDKSAVDRSDVRQRERIRDGVRSGDLTRDEAQDLRRDQRRIHRVERRVKSDGTVSDRERHRIRRMKRHESRDIYREKHDGEKRGD